MTVIKLDVRYGEIIDMLRARLCIVLFLVCIKTWLAAGLSVTWQFISTWHDDPDPYDCHVASWKVDDKSETSRNCPADSSATYRWQSSRLFMWKTTTWCETVMQSGLFCYYAYWKKPNRTVCMFRIRAQPWPSMTTMCCWRCWWWWLRL